MLRYCIHEGPTTLRLKLAISLMTLTIFAHLSLAADPDTVEHGTVQTDAISVDPPPPGLALARYIANSANGHPWSEPDTVSMEIDASLPQLSEKARLRAIRHWVGHQKPKFQVIQTEGDATVIEQVIERYLTAETQAAAIPASSVVMTPANYKIHYLKANSAPSVYAFQIAPRRKLPGLIKGELWIDGNTGLAVHEAGYLVKKPSIFIRRIKMTRDITLRDGTPCLRTTHFEIDTRLVGRAELTIVESPCSPVSSTIAHATVTDSYADACSIGQ
jgi:hypothetical protein